MKQSHNLKNTAPKIPTRNRRAREVEYIQEVAVRLIRERYSNATSRVIRSPQDAYEILRHEYDDLPVERLSLVLLDTRNKTVAISNVTTGLLNSSTGHSREIFQRAILANCASVILAHNHPSGDPTPSSEDIELTKKIAAAGDILEIRVLDHIIVGDNTFVSLKERGLF